MKKFEATATIDSSADKVWSVLVDTAKWPEWDPVCDRIEGTPALGAKLKAFTKLAPGRGFGATVTEFAPGKRMTWTAKMPLGLFQANRTMTIEKRGDRVQFTLREVFEGPMMVLIGRTLPDLNPAFIGFVQGLKKRSEAR